LAAAPATGSIAFDAITAATTAKIRRPGDIACVNVSSPPEVRHRWLDAHQLPFCRGSTPPPTVFLHRLHRCILGFLAKVAPPPV
jgi:hypothetical protein